MLGMPCAHATASGMCGMRAAGDLVARMSDDRGMRIGEAKAYVAERLGVSPFDLSDPIARAWRTCAGSGSSGASRPSRSAIPPSRAPWKPSSGSPSCWTCRSTACSASGSTRGWREPRRLGGARHFVNDQLTQTIIGDAPPAQRRRGGRTRKGADGMTSMAADISAVTAEKAEVCDPASLWPGGTR